MIVMQTQAMAQKIEAAAAGQEVDWSKLAIELGYFDQAHFIKDFKAMIGLPPAEYAKQLA